MNHTCKAGWENSPIEDNQFIEDNVNCAGIWRGFIVNLMLSGIRGGEKNEDSFFSRHYLIILTLI